MIKIENTEIDNIAQEYFDDVKEKIKERCTFLILILDVLYNGSNNNVLNNFRLIHGKTRVSITNQFLRINKVSNQTQYANVVLTNAHPWVTVNQNSFRNIANYLNNDTHLKELVLCSPENSLNSENSIKAAIRIPVLSTELKNFINMIIDFSLFDKYAYDIASKLNINTCPYCNRNYINTVIDKNRKGIVRPTFDHFFPQKHHPFLALSFYNLIPCCYYCNSSLKSATPTSIDTHIHPYYEGYDSDTTFNVVINRCKPAKSDPENYSLKLYDNMDPTSPNDRYKKIFGGTRLLPDPSEGNVNLFKLEDIYQSHLDIVGELIVKCDKLNSWYAGSLLKIFELLGTNKSEFYQYYFGNYINEKDFNRRPMAKLTKDVVNQRLPKFIK